MKNKKLFLLLLLIPLIVFFVGRSFSLPDKEEDEELELDNWEISTVFYDSTVDNGLTPLTEINWDASDGGYGLGETRVIKIQINYKNRNTIRDYDLGELLISIPWLTSEESNLSITTFVGANDSSHTGYDWDVQYLSEEKLLIFMNAVEFSNRSNFEGTIEILYEITPEAETPEGLLDECIHTLFKGIKATLYTSDNKFVFNYYEKTTDYSFEDDESELYAAYFNKLEVFGPNVIAILEDDDRVIQLPRSSTSLSSVSNKFYRLKNRINLQLGFERSSSFITVKGNVIGYTNHIDSNMMSFNYTRTYVHQWTKYEYQLSKTPSKVDNLDGLQNVNDYIWVKYNFSFRDSNTHSNYNLIRYSKSNEIIYIEDELPEGCVVYHDGKLVDHVGDKYRFEISIGTKSNFSNLYMNTRNYEAIVGYPKSIYNVDNNNLNISNQADLYLIYDFDNEYTHVATATVDLNLYDYNSIELGSLYSHTKSIGPNLISESGPCVNCYYPKYYQAIVEGDTSFNNADLFNFLLSSTAKYSGSKMNVRVGDDYLMILNSNNQYVRLNENEYYWNTIRINGIKNSYGTSILDKYNWKLYVRKANSELFELYEENIKVGNYTFPENQKIVEFYIYGENISDSAVINAYAYLNINKQDIARKGTIINYSYFMTYIKNNENELILANPGTISSYNALDYKETLIANDNMKYGQLIQRSMAKDTWDDFVLTQPKSTYSISKRSLTNPMNQSEGNKEYIGEYILDANILSNGQSSCKYYQLHQDEYDPKYSVKGIVVYDLLPEGMELASTKSEIINSIDDYLYSTNGSFRDSEFNIVPKNTNFVGIYIKPYITEDDIEIYENWRNTNRTLIKVTMSFGGHHFWFFQENGQYSGLRITLNYKVRVSYDNYADYGDIYKNETYIEPLNTEASCNQCQNDIYDVNNDGSFIDKMGYYSATMSIVSVLSTNQDVQTTVQSELNNYAIGKVNTLQESEYTYKLRVRTGQNNITNLVIYDSIEDYAKNSNLEIVKASGGKQYWQGEFLGVDTYYAESKGYNVKVYYNESPKPGSLKGDNTWKEYTVDTDKSKVKALAFEYLDFDDNPAVLPANSLTYVLIKMKSPSEDYIAYAYNGCWTEWNAIDPITGRPVDFITGINSNIVKVALPRSIEVEDIELTLVKKWVDGNNSLSTRPNNVTFNLISNDDTSNANEVVLTGTGNEWSTNVSVPELDNLGNEIEYSVTENSINLTDGYRYIETINDLTITNTLYKDITLTKVWKDNKDAYLTRPENVAYIIKQNNNDYKTITFSGSLTADEWSKVISVPVYDAEGNEYTYTVTEEEIDGYSTTCESLTCTNTLTGNDTITVKKVWNDNDNSYNTRPNSIDIKLKQNGNDYQTVTLSGNTNTWESDSITIPKYDSNGVKYEYTISETQLNKYGLVVYDQANYQVTNTLKENINITVTKKWVDGSNEQGIRPNELKINLLRNNEQYQELTLSGTEDIWTTTIEVPKYDDNQVLYTYTIKEITEDLNSDYSNITYGEDLSVTNKLKKEKDIQVSKIWDDSNNKYMTRPDKVTINLLRNGELYQELELNNNNSWKKDITDLEVYDDNGKLYKYTIEENLSTQLSRYETITYDQTNYTITNKLTDIPKVTLYFTVKNGYTSSGSNDIQYDTEGLNKILNKYKINADDPYEYDFKLENVDTGEIVTGKLSTQGNLKFEDISYGTYRATEEKDKYFVYVLMNEIEAVNGVTFKEDEDGGTIAITPTGKDILYGVNIVNKIEYEPSTPITSANRNFILIYLLLIVSIFVGLYCYKKKA